MGLCLRKKAFTLTELLVVVLIAGIMASFAIPNYSKAVERSHQTDAVNQLTTIWSANQVYRAQNGRFWPPDNNGGFGYLIVDINTNLALGVIENGMTYNCVGAGAPPGTFACTAARKPPAPTFTVRVTEAVLSATNPDPCVGGVNCP